MSNISFSQIIVLLILGFLLFGDLTKLFNNIKFLKKKIKKKEI